MSRPDRSRRALGIALAVALLLGARGARAQDPQPPSQREPAAEAPAQHDPLVTDSMSAQMASALLGVSRAELVQLRAEASAQIRQGTCVEPAREVREIVNALLGGARGVARRALLHYLPIQRAVLTRCSVGSGGIPRPPPTPPPISPPDGPPRRGLVIIPASEVRAASPRDRDPTAFHRLLRTRIAIARYCYEREGLARDPDARGRVALRAMVDRDGRVPRVEVTERDAALPESVGTCIAQRLLRGAMLPPAEGEAAGEDRTATYTWRMRLQPEE